MIIPAGFMVNFNEHAVVLSNLLMNTMNTQGGERLEVHRARLGSQAVDHRH